MEKNNTVEGSKLINKLVLVVNESCNLRCSYCYVRNSPNKRNNGRMDPESARNIIRGFLSSYDRCNFIQFFGGEPTLNLAAIEAVVEETKRLVNSGQLKNEPRFGIVTNGVFQDFDQTISVLKRHNIETTVSLDGPAHIHNELRHEKNGSPTYDRVVKTIRVLLKEKLPVAMETVYTALYIRKRCSIVDIFNICREMGIAKLIFEIAYPPAPKELNQLLDPYFDPLLTYYQKAVDWWFKSLIKDNKMALDVYFKDLVRPMIEGLPAAVAKGGCPAGDRDFAIGPNGDIFVCQLLYGYPDYLIGNILTDYTPAAITSFPNGSEDIDVCRECFIRHWCQPCAALNLYWGNPWVPPKRECHLRKTVILRLGFWAFAYLNVPDNEITKTLRKHIQHSI